MRGSDVLDRLSRSAPTAAAKLSRIIAQEEAASGAYASHAARLAEARDTAKIAGARLRELQALRGDHPQLLSTIHRTYEPPGERRVVIAAQDREHALAPFIENAAVAAREVEHLEKSMMELKNGNVFIGSRLVNWVRSIPGSIPLEPFKGKIAPPPKGADIKTVIDELRSRLIELNAELQQVITAPFPLSTVRQQVKSFVETMAARGSPDLLRTVQLNHAPGLPMTTIYPHGSNAGIAVPDTGSLVFFLFRDVILERMLAEAEDVAEEDSALSPDQRRDKQQEILAQKLKIGRTEELIIEQAALDHVTIERRGDSDPRAVLGLADHLPPPD